MGQRATIDVAETIDVLVCKNAGFVPEPVPLDGIGLEERGGEDWVSQRILLSV
jgi:hypothetical protein